MISRFAKKEDITNISQFRVFSLVSEHGLPLDEASFVEQNTAEYLKNELGKTCFISLAEDDQEIVSIAFLCIFYRLPSNKHPTGKYAQLYGVFTSPDYRGNGYAKDCVSLLLKQAESLDIDAVALNSTEAAQNMYERLGFEHARTLPALVKKYDYNKGVKK